MMNDRIVGTPHVKRREEKQELPVVFIVVANFIK